MKNQRSRTEFLLRYFYQEVAREIHGRPADEVSEGVSAALDRTMDLFAVLMPDEG